MTDTVIDLKQLVELFGLPTRPELIAMGKNINIENYRRVATRVANAHLAPFLLVAMERDAESYELRPMNGYDWRDVAYLLGNAYNLANGASYIQGLSDFLNLPMRLGGEAPYANYRQAVMANLELVANSGDLPAKAMIKVIDDMWEVKQALAGTQAA